MKFEFNEGFQSYHPPFRLWSSHNLVSVMTSGVSRELTALPQAVTVRIPARYRWSGPSMQNVAKCYNIWQHIWQNVARYDKIWQRVRTQIKQLLQTNTELVAHLWKPVCPDQYIYIYIYIYAERERERDRESYVCVLCYIIVVCSIPEAGEAGARAAGARWFRYVYNI